MTNYGVFRDDFYNAACVYTEGQFTTAAFTGGSTLVAAAIAGARDAFVALTGASGTFTTDTAVNIIAQLNSAIQAAYKANVGGFSSSLGAQPAVSGTPNFFNFTWILDINCSGTSTAATLAPGTGVTLAAIGALSSTALPFGAAQNARYVCQVTGPVSITMTRVQ
jgi:hypothetical protein